MAFELSIVEEALFAARVRALELSIVKDKVVVGNHLQACRHGLSCASSRMLDH